MAAVFSLTGYLGVNFVLALIGSFGVLTAVTGNYITVEPHSIASSMNLCWRTLQ